jgi:hypothetical protein
LRNVLGCVTFHDQHRPSRHAKWAHLHPSPLRKQAGCVSWEAVHNNKRETKNMADASGQATMLDIDVCYRKERDRFFFEWTESSKSNFPQIVLFNPGAFKSWFLRWLERFCGRSPLCYYS